MNIRELSIYWVVFATCVSAVSAAEAQPNSFSSVTPERVAELEMMHQQAMDFLLKNDFQGAIRMYSDILLVEPDDETAYTGLGQIYMVQGRYEQAHEAFKNALHINGDNEVALAGVRKILDPDGVEGMTSKTELETEGTLPVYEALLSPAPGARMEKRQSAVKAKKGTFAAAPARSAPRFGRLGLLNAQRTQMALRNAGFYRGPVNGLIGVSTKEAIREFQKNFGLETSGRITPQTWSKLSEYLNVRR